MAEALRFTLPLPPSKNRLTRRVRMPGGGFRTYPSPAKKRFVRLVKLLGKGTKPIADGKVRVELLVFRGLDKNGKLKRGDLANYEELTLDALQGVAYRNDSQIRRLVTELFDDREHPRVEVRVEPYVQVYDEFTRPLDHFPALSMRFDAAEQVTNAPRYGKPVPATYRPVGKR